MKFGYVGYFDRDACDLDEFKVLTAQSLDAAEAPHAAEIVKNVPVYDMATLRPLLDEAGPRRALLAEWRMCCATPPASSRCETPTRTPPS